MKINWFSALPMSTIDRTNNYDNNYEKSVAEKAANFDGAMIANLTKQHLPSRDKSNQR
jgi:hypothetical protein